MVFCEKVLNKSNLNSKGSDYLGFSKKEKLKLDEYIQSVLIIF